MRPSSESWVWGLGFEGFGRWGLCFWGLGLETLGRQAFGLCWVFVKALYFQLPYRETMLCTLDPFYGH